MNQEIWEISKDEVWNAMKRTKNRKAIGPDDIPLKAWKYLG